MKLWTVQCSFASHTDGADASDPSIQTDEAGDRYALADWSNELPPVTPTESPRAGKRASTEER